MDATDEGGDDMAEYTNASLQTVAAGQNALFSASPVPCDKGLIVHRDGSGIFTLRGIVPYNFNCGCRRNDFARYLVTFGANIAIPEGGTVEPISLAIAIDGEVLPDSTVIFTPAAAEEFGNVSRSVFVAVPRGCCENVAVENTSTQAIDVQQLNIVFARPDLYVTR